MQAAASASIQQSVCPQGVIRMRHPALPESYRVLRRKSFRTDSGRSFRPTGYRAMLPGHLDGAYFLDAVGSSKSI
jgi:hypothetical protein